jgi:radical SAM superfamily enzyme YgiQ (UPF0313 family)
MKEAGAVLLVACYEMGHQPLAVASPAAFLQRAGYLPATMDLSVEPFDTEKVARARMIAISVPMHTALRLGVRVAARVRRVNPRAHVCLYGLYAVLNASYLLAHDVDSVIGAEAEPHLVALARRLADPSAPSPPPVTGRVPFITPSRHALPSLERYAQLNHDGGRRLVAYVESSRGCKHMCRHCPIPPVYGGRFVVVPKDIVLADVRQQVEAGATHVSFGDPDFLNGPGHALAVARAVHAEFPAVTFDFTAKVEHLLRHRAHLSELAALGCLFIVTAAESLDDDVLRHLDKGHTRADIEEALALTRGAGITLRPTWVAFTPWTTLNGYRAWLEFIAAHDLVDAVDAVQYSVRLLVPPGSLLADHPAMRPYLGELVAEDFYFKWVHPDARMDRLQYDVSRAVADAASRDEDVAVTFDRVRALANEAAGIDSAPHLVVRPDRRRAPRLTEPWFC